MDTVLIVRVCFVYFGVRAVDRVGGDDCCVIDCHLHPAAAAVRRRNTSVSNRWQQTWTSKYFQKKRGEREEEKWKKRIKVSLSLMANLCKSAPVPVDLLLKRSLLTIWKIKGWDQSFKPNPKWIACVVSAQLTRWWPCNTRTLYFLCRSVSFCFLQRRKKENSQLYAVKHWSIDLFFSISLFLNRVFIFLLLLLSINLLPAGVK